MLEVSPLHLDVQFLMLTCKATGASYERISGSDDTDEM
uniref:Uncharacterized protein n=1 Tax=Rhizophora mucronata TaxID=61149 RepID=A0A2P2PK89_RHIMU